MNIFLFKLNIILHVCALKDVLQIQEKFYEEEERSFSDLKTVDKRCENEQNTHSQQSHIEVLAFRILVKSL